MVQSKTYQQPAQHTLRVDDGMGRIVIPDALTLASEESLLARAAPGATLEINGIVLENQPTRGGFILSGGITVRVSKLTSYFGGWAMDVERNTPVRVEGTLARDGAVIAKRVTFRSQTHPPSAGPPGSR